MYKRLFSCKNKIAVVTGGCGLIGREIAKGLADFGSMVYVADIDKKKATYLLKGTRIKYIYLDATSVDSIKKAMDSIVQERGRIDILVNASYPRTKDWGLELEKVSFESWKSNVNDHLGGYFLCCQIAGKIMKRQKGGIIINLASIYGMVGPDFTIYKGTDMTMPAPYSAIKGGIVNLTKYFATYYAKYNIRVNSISPGGIFDNQHPSFVKKYIQKTPLGRMGNPEDIAGTVIYLASDASLYVTGSNLVVDGGWTAW